MQGEGRSLSFRSSQGEEEGRLLGWRKSAKWSGRNWSTFPATNDEHGETAGALTQFECQYHLTNNAIVNRCLLAIGFGSLIARNLQVAFLLGDKFLCPWYARDYLMSRATHLVI